MSTTRQPTTCNTDPCIERHCRVCRRAHVTVDGHGTDLTCAACLHETRDHLHGIVDLVAALPAEAARKGVDSEAMALLGPAADPDQWDARATLALAGKTVLADCDARDLEQLRVWLDEHRLADRHPLFVLGAWELMWRDTLDVARSTDDSLTAAAAYLDNHLHHMAHFEHLDFEGLARDLRACHRKLEDVLHAGERRDQGAPCTQCGALLERVWGDTSHTDAWLCPRCGHTVSDHEYRADVDRDHLDHAPALTAADIERIYGTDASATRVRVWGSRGHVRKAGRTADGTYLYVVADVEARLGITTDDPPTDTAC